MLVFELKDYAITAISGLDPAWTVLERCLQLVDRESERLGNTLLSVTLR
jgi:hypothetical protein